MLPSIGSVLIQRVDNSNIGVHVVRNVVLVLLPLIFELSSNLLSEHSHMLLHALLDLLLDQESDSLPHVVWDLFKLGVVLPVENIGLELALTVWIGNQPSLLVQRASTHILYE